MWFRRNPDEGFADRGESESRRFVAGRIRRGVREPTRCRCHADGEGDLRPIGVPDTGAVAPVERVQREHASVDAALRTDAPPGEHDRRRDAQLFPQSHRSDRSRLGRVTSRRVDGRYAVSSARAGDTDLCHAEYESRLLRIGHRAHLHGVAAWLAVTLAKQVRLVRTRQPASEVATGVAQRNRRHHTARGGQCTQVGACVPRAASHGASPGAHRSVRPAVSPCGCERRGRIHVRDARQQSHRAVHDRTLLGALFLSIRLGQIPGV